MDAGEALKRLLGGLLLAVGIILALSCGLCTGGFGIYAIILLFDEKSRGGSLVISPFLVAGLVATAIGVGLAWGGLAILRTPRVRGNGPPDNRRDGP